MGIHHDEVEFLLQSFEDAFQAVSGQRLQNLAVPLASRHHRQAGQRRLLHAFGYFHLAQQHFAQPGLQRQLKELMNCRPTQVAVDQQRLSSRPGQACRQVTGQRCLSFARHGARHLNHARRPRAGLVQ